MSKSALFTLALATVSGAVTDSRLTAAVISSTRICSAVSSTANGRLFLYWSTYLDDNTGPLLTEQLSDNSSIPFPNEEWNSYNSSNATQNPEDYFVGIAAQRVGPDGNLWVLDAGTGDPAPKLVAFNVTTRELAQRFTLENATTNSTHWDDFRFNGNMVYLTDIGNAALGILDTETGANTRVLQDDKSTTGYFPVSAEGRVLVLSTGEPHYDDADQLEVSPDGVYLYYQPCNGGLWRIETALLDKALHNETAANALSDSVVPYAPTVSTGGTAIDADGTVYASDTDNNAVLRTFSNGTTEVLIQDDRLQWVDAMWVDAQQRLWMPVNQLFRGSRFGNGTATYEPPFYVFTMDIGVGPSLIDHA